MEGEKEALGRISEGLAEGEVNGDMVLELVQANLAWNSFCGWFREGTRGTGVLGPSRERHPRQLQQQGISVGGQ